MEFTDSTTNQEILQIVHSIRNSNHADKKSHFFQKYPEFAKNYPWLFHASLNPNFPLDQLELMLRKREELQKGTSTVDDADTTVYKVLKEKYVYPVLDKAGIEYSDNKSD